MGLRSDILDIIERYSGLVVEAGMPDWVDPMLATLTGKRFSDQNWIYERKFDGERCLAYCRGGVVKLYTRNRKDIGDNYPEVRDALSRLGGGDYIVDGEIVAFDGENTSFSRLQGRIGVRSPDAGLISMIIVYYYVFDIVYVDGYLIENLPLRLRKKVLRRRFSFQDPVRYTEHIVGEGVKYYREACRKGWEGVIAKRGDSPYQHRRSADWLKFKCVNQQEFVVGGYTAPKGGRPGLGALLVGYYDKGQLIYAGKVGTGFDEQTLIELAKELEKIRISRPPFREVDRSASRDFWVKPKMVVEVGFTEWTRTGKLRHPRFQGVRRDKEPQKVIREVAEA